MVDRIIRHTGPVRLAPPLIASRGATGHYAGRGDVIAISAAAAATAIVTINYRRPLP